jgi:hypothetical protein
MEVIKVEPDVDSEVYLSSAMSDGPLTYLQPEKCEIKVRIVPLFVSILCKVNFTLIPVFFFDSCAVY